MKIITNATIGGMTVHVVVRKRTTDRLQHTCFRGKGIALAGNFSEWECEEDLFGDTWTIAQLIEDARKANHDGATQNSLCLDFRRDIGWSSTDIKDKFNPSQTEHFFFSNKRKGWGRRVKLDQKSLLAPKTSLVTIIYELKFEALDDKAIIVVHSIYPGPDIGELMGDVTERESMIFFDWQHPGER